jgi:hypothetical protein
VAGHNNWTAQEKATHFLVIQGQAADEQWTCARVCHCYQEVDLLGPCQTAPVIHPEGGSLCICQRDEKLGCEVPSPERVFYKAFSQVMRLEAAKTAASSPARLQMVRSGAPIGTQSPGVVCCRTGWPTCWHFREIGHFGRDCPKKGSLEGGWWGPRKEEDTSTIPSASTLHT